MLSFRGTKKLRRKFTQRMYTGDKLRGGEERLNRVFLKLKNKDKFKIAEEMDNNKQRREGEVTGIRMTGSYKTAYIYLKPSV